LSVLEELVENGMNCARMNTAYATLEEYQQRYDYVKRAGQEKEKDVSVMMDLKGTQLRVHANGIYAVELGQRINVGFNSGPVSFSHDFGSAVQRGDEIYFENGTIKTKVIKVTPTHLSLEVYDAGEGEIRNMMGVNVPEKYIPLENLTKKDELVVDFGVENRVEYFALSFVRSFSDVQKLMGVIEESKQKKGVTDYSPGIIVKIEDYFGVANLSSILINSQKEGIDVSVMLARGDLFVEVPPEKFMGYQNKIMSTCKAYGVSVIVATGLLESMQYSARPTRSEVIDTSYAVISGADGLMLSGETSNGIDPVNAVKMLKQIVDENI